MSIRELTVQLWQKSLSNSGVASFPWDAPEEPPEPLNAQESSDAIYGNPTGMQLPQHLQHLSQTAGDFPGAQESLRGLLRNNGDSGQASGGLVLPGGGQIAQSDGSVSEESVVKLSASQIDEIIANNLKRGRIPSQDKLESGLELELDIPPHILQKLQLQQTDGGVGGDSDGINSDLDDSDEDHDSYAEDDDLENGMIMLCLYDKVQRVKNKWKYVLKDGIANINGKDYLFAKATGESEW